jgi:DNA-binding MarR family transcriptional regulator
MGTKKSTPATPTDMDALAEALRETVGKFVRSVRSEAGTPTNAQSETLAYLERNGPVSIAALAESRGVKHQSMRLVTSKLEEAGLIAMEPDPKDGRSYLVTLTRQGQKENAQARIARTRWLATALSKHTSAHEREVLQDALRILQRLTTLDPR